MTKSTTYATLLFGVCYNNKLDFILRFLAMA